MKRFLYILSIIFLSTSLCFAGPLNSGPVSGGGGVGGSAYNPANVAITGGSISGVTGSFTSLNGKRTAVGAADYNPSALTTDYIIAITDTAAARAVIIPTEDEDSGTTAQPRIIVVKDESGGAAAHNITVSLESGGNIDDIANFVIDQNYQSITLYMDGTNAWIY